MSQFELLKKVIIFLNNDGIEYMLTGSIVSSMQGEPRSTHDIDIIIIINEKHIKNITDYFRMPEFYIDEYSIKDALKNKSMFNLISSDTGDKIDFWIYTDDEFDNSRFKRKYAESIEGINIYVSSPEDTILAKLKWSKLSGGSRKQFIDALRVYELQNDIIEEEYLENWAEKLSVADLLSDLRKESKKL